MSDLLAVRLDEAIAEIERELDLRLEVYSRRVQAGRMSKLTADRQMERLEAACAFLLEFKRLKGGDYVGDHSSGALAG